ncbi:sulfatase [Bacteroides helcogenes]|uniref:Sulfatase n=1 Tax=Bacteroides helcogenes (strain ATCC 35417 / DSM 20613 / JCM 6297 / CCUG 15421 / P 36-108) TaxID=693979 RepID=E6SPF6_BACT6|nr:sulfatase [Bacteroides helcogenes]ADV42845.1 sulfatase [Bacteroides helcogenes P 36-108]MDY5239078.1 sulfatase [Bacteroides helcogenes]
MNKYLLYSLALTSTAATLLTVQAQKTPTEKPLSSRPNIILFMVDDMGWQDTSLPFWTQKTHYNEVYETPNMERLARQGMMFTQAYACNISSATRCSLLTGANMSRHRVTNWTLQRDKQTDRKSQTIDLPDWNYNGISQVEGINNTFVGTSFVELLRRSGYHTIHCGKAHFGSIDTPGENPTHWGFEVNIAGHAAGGLATYLSEKNYGHTRDGKPTSLMSIPGLENYWGTGVFATEALTREAVKALDKAKKYNQPFYLYMAHYAIHVPVDKDMRFFPKYVRKGLSDKEAAYASLIEGMDKSLGDLMDWLEENGEADNTIILFMSDNGGLASEPGWRDGKIHTQNAPLNSGKGSLYEGGIREPMIVSWPGTVKPGTRCNDYLMIEDFYPTILDMAGVKNYTTVSPVDGISFLPLLKGTGNPSKGRSLVWNCPNIWGNDGPGINLNCAIRKDDWKLVYYYETGAKELFCIPEDIGEKDNVASRHPDIVKRLSKELGEYLRKVGGQRPSFKASGQPCPWPDEVR